MLSEQTLTKTLSKYFSATDEMLEAFQKKASKKKVSLEQYILDKKIVSDKDLYRAASKTLKVPFVTLSDKDIAPEVLKTIPAPLADQHRIVPFQKTDKTISIAMLDPEDIQTIEFLRRKIGLTPKIHLTTPSDIREVLKKLHHADIERDKTLRPFSDEFEGEAPPTHLKHAAEDIPVVNLVTNIVEHAVYEDASDIHIEPTEASVIVRYRVDGVLRNVMTLPKSIQDGLLARIKVISNLKIDEHRVPQDGRFKITLGEEKLSFRVSIIPVYDGEKIVMRILHEGQHGLTLDKLGLQAEAKTLVQKAIKRPHGMILVTGPTGSGKTTTLYSVLNILNKPGVNISTIEDPIEYHVGGINQSQINPKVGFTFASGLRAFLRQDPDIIMVGEIRDEETAEIAAHAAMTGHLVLSTLHTNDAPTTIPRLTDMGVPPFLVATTVNIIIAQRLVRKLDKKQATAYKLSSKEIKQLSELIDIKRLPAIFKAHGVKLSASEKTLKSMTFYRPKNDIADAKSDGYKGRIGIYEILPIDPVLAKRINEGATVEDIREYSKDQGMVSLLEDGLVKAKLGITSIDEVLRVSRE